MKLIREDEFSLQIEINQTTLSYKSYGEGFPVLCLHGFAVDSDLMINCLEPIFSQDERFMRVYIDLVGMGETPADYKIKNSDDLLKLIIEFINKEFGEKEFILVGESYGGYLSLGLIKHFGSRIKGTFFICPCVVAVSSERNLPERQLLHNTPLLVSKEMQKDYDSFLEYAVVADEDIWENYQSSVLTGVKKADFEYLNWFQENGYAFSENINDVKYHQPAVFLLGRQDHIVGYKDALKLVNNFSRGSFFVLDFAGHNLQIEQVSFFRQVVSDFLLKF